MFPNTRTSKIFDRECPQGRFVCHYSFSFFPHFCIVLYALLLCCCCCCGQLRELYLEFRRASGWAVKETLLDVISLASKSLQELTLHGMLAFHTEFNDCVNLTSLSLCPSTDQGGDRGFTASFPSVTQVSFSGKPVEDIWSVDHGSTVTSVRLTHINPCPIRELFDKFPRFQNVCPALKIAPNTSTQ